MVSKQRYRFGGLTTKWDLKYQIGGCAQPVESPEVSIRTNYHLSTLTACRLKISQLDNWTQPLGNLLTTDWLGGTLELKVFWYPYLFLGYGFSEILIIKLKPVWICFHTNFYFIVSFYSVFTIVSLLAHMRFERSP